MKRMFNWSAFTLFSLLVFNSEVIATERMQYKKVEYFKVNAKLNMQLEHINYIKDTQSHDSSIELIDINAPLPSSSQRVWFEGSRLSGLNASQGATLNYSFLTHIDMKSLRFQIIGDNGDADLYVSKNVAPTREAYDCSSLSVSSNETCDFSNTAADTYHIMVYGYQAYQNLTLRITFSLDSLTDTDSDGLSNGEEYQYRTNPLDMDTDSDWFYDGEEVYGTFGTPTDPLKLDTDSDFLSDYYEIFNSFTNPTLLDTDGDGLLDGVDNDGFTKTVNKRYVDINKNGFVDMPIIGKVNTTNYMVQFYDVKLGVKTKQLWSPVWFLPTSVTVVSDMNSDGINDTLLFGETSDGKKAWLTLDTATNNILKSVAFPAWFTPNKLIFVEDFSGNRKDETLVLGSTSDGKNLWMLHDGGTGVEMARHIYPSWFTPTTLMIGGNGNNPVVIARGVTSDYKSAYIAQDLKSKQQLATGSNVNANNLASIQLTSSDANNLDELTWLGTTWDNRKFLVSQDLQTADVKNDGYFPAWYVPKEISSIDFYWGALHNYILTLGTTTDNKNAWMVFTKAAGTPLATSAFPLWFNPRKISSIPNAYKLNNTEVFERSAQRIEDNIFILGETSDGKSVIFVQNSYDFGNGINTLTTIVLPSNFKPIY